MNKTQRQVQQIESRVFGSANTVGVLHQIEERGRNQRDLSNTLQSDPIGNKVRDRPQIQRKATKLIT